MRAISSFEQQVLLWASDDYETPQTIAGDLSRDLGRTVEPAEVFAAFYKLVSLGLVSAFEYEPTAQRFRAVDISMLTKISEPWFLAVEHGNAT